MESITLLDQGALAKIRAILILTLSSTVLWLMLPTAAFAQNAGWEARWDQTVAAAKHEGKLSLVGAPGEVYRKVWDAFSKRYGIEVELLAGQGSSILVPRITTERRAGKYLWDVIVHSPGSQFRGLKPRGFLTPLRPLLILPEDTDDTNWLGGFDAGWADKEKKYVYQLAWFSNRVVLVNRSVIPESEFNKLDQLFDPKWKGKVCMQDPRVPSAGTLSLGTMLVGKGEAKIREFLKEVQPVLTRDRRQLSEWVLRGRCPIAIGIAPQALADLKLRGIDVSQLQWLDDDDPANILLNGGTGAVSVFTHAPHPNAAKVFVNWLLSREGAELYTHTGYNVRRTDVPPIDKEQVVDPNKPAFNLQTEETQSAHLKAMKIAKEVMK